METISRPTKEQVRKWFESRRQTPKPLPSYEQVRRQLGWGRCGNSDRRPSKIAA